MNATIVPTTCLALAMLLLCSAPPAGAQERTAPPDEQPVPMWVKTFGKQLKQSLESDDPLIQSQALQHITYFSNFYGGDLDLTEAVPTLVDLYRRDDDANVRLHALVALYAIGDDRGMQQVRKYMHSQDWPPRLQFVTIAALMSHFGPQTFEMDQEAAVMAERLMAYYTQPRIEVGPLQVVQPGAPNTPPNPPNDDR
jgi:hypothetical protein